MRIEVRIEVQGRLPSSLSLDDDEEEDSSSIACWGFPLAAAAAGAASLPSSPRNGRAFQPKPPDIRVFEVKNWVKSGQNVKTYVALRA